MDENQKEKGLEYIKEWLKDSKHGIEELGKFPKKPEMTKYTGKFTYGIDDLKSPDPYYVPSGQWPSFNSAFEDVTEEQYNKDPEGYKIRITEWNDNHIKELKEKGLYLQPYEIEINVIHNPLYDDPKIKNHPLESHKMIFMDFGDSPQEIKKGLESSINQVKKQRTKVTLKQNPNDKI